MRNLTITQVLAEFGWDVYEHLIDGCGIAKVEQHGIKYLLVYNSAASTVNSDLGDSTLIVSVIEAKLPFNFVWDESACGAGVMYAMAAGNRLKQDEWVRALGRQLLELEEKRAVFDQQVLELGDLIREEADLLSIIMATIMGGLQLDEPLEKMDMAYGFDELGINIALLTPTDAKDLAEMRIDQYLEEYIPMLNEALGAIMYHFGFTSNPRIQVSLLVNTHVEVKIAARDFDIEECPVRYIRDHTKFYSQTKLPLLESAEMLLVADLDGYDSVSDDCRWN